MGGKTPLSRCWEYLGSLRNQSFNVYVLCYMNPPTLRHKCNLGSVEILDVQAKVQLKDIIFKWDAQ